MFQTPPEQIVIANTEYQPLFEEMDLHQGLTHSQQNWRLKAHTKFDFKKSDQAALHHWLSLLSDKKEISYGDKLLNNCMYIEMYG